MALTRQRRPSRATYTPTVFQLLWLLSICAFKSSTAFLSNPSSLLSTTRSIRQIGAFRHSPLYAVSHDESSDKAQYLATCVPGLAHILEKELYDIATDCDTDISDISTSGNAAVTFSATREASLYALCWLRSAHRLSELMAATEGVYERQDIHDFVRDNVNVKDLLGDGQGGLLTISVKAILNSPRQLPKDLSHSHFTALEVKNALVDFVRDMRGDRPNVDVDSPDVPLVCVLRGTERGASLSLYRSLHPPGSLHKRGYRQGSAIHKAAMKESMAAGLLLEAGWKERADNVRNGEKDAKQLRLIDPMAGSGSLILEAGMMAADIAPGIMRIRCGLDEHRMPPVTKWKSNTGQDTATMWKEVLLDATRRAKNGIRVLNQDPSPIQIMANDIHSGAVDIMESALANAGLENFVEIFEMDCYDLEVEEKPDTQTIVTTNPPWGVRLTDDIEESWEGLKHFARDTCPSGTQLFVLSGDKAATASLRLKRDRMIPIQTGDQHLRFIQYTIGGKHQPAKDAENEPKSTSAPELEIPKPKPAPTKEALEANEWI